MSKYNESVSSLIRDYRSLRGMGQLELAEKLGYGTSQFISNVERGICGFPLAKIKKLCKILVISKELARTAWDADSGEQFERAWGKKTTK